MRFSIRSKKIISSLMALTMLTAATAAAESNVFSKIIPTNTITADAAVSGTWTYQVTSSTTCTLTGYTGNEQRVYLPIELNGYKVTKIGTGAFMNNHTMKMCQFGYNIEEIGTNAFRNCTSLTQVYINSGAKIIGTSAFENCTALTYASCPPNLDRIKSRAFANTAITSFSDPYLHDDVKYIESYAFLNCHNLTEIHFKDKWELGMSVFENCDLLENVEISDYSVRSGLANRSFKGAHNLQFVYGHRLYAWNGPSRYIMSPYNPTFGRNYAQLLEDEVRMALDFHNGVRD